MVAQDTPPGLLISLWRWFLVILTSVMALTPLLPVCLASQGWRCATLRGWCAGVRRILGVVLEIDNPEPVRPSPALYVHLNQTSLSEGIVMPGALPGGYITFVNVKFALLPWLGWLVAMDGVLVIRSWRAQARRASLRAMGKLQRGKNLYISIEGRRSPDGTLQPYKRGPIHMAIRCNVPIVPIVILGAREVLPYGEWRVRPGKVRVVFGPTTSLAGRSLDERDTIAAELRHMAEDMIHVHTRSSL
jgi:1-acyl-sn-glycerol-3-phosphate acyltransferase